MVQMICLANSWRENGRCIAGINTSTGTWIRPTFHRGATIPELRTKLQGRFLEPLDILSIPVVAPKRRTKYQRENVTINSWSWSLVGRAAAKNLLRYCTTESQLLHSPHKVVDPATMEALPPEKWASLELVHARNARFVRDSRKADRWDVRFSTIPGGIEYFLRLTDPVATRRLNEGQKLPSECLLTTSLTQPVALPNADLPELCYKVVAAVMEL